MSRLPGLLLILGLAGCRSAAPGPETVSCEILVVGGSLGGVAAAIGAEGRDLWIVEDSDWVGGQVTSQGVSALDEHRYIETFGGTRRYDEFRRRVRNASGGRPNPGGGWVSRLCFEPRAGLAALQEMLGPARVLLGSRVAAARVEDDRIVSVDVARPDGSHVRFEPRFVLDATDAGDFLPFAGAAFRTGAEAASDTGEPHAPDTADPGRLQSFTWCFAVEHRPGENHVIPEPQDYARFRDAQPYTLDHWYEGRGRVRYGFFEKTPGTPGSFFDYRKIGDALALINWPSNDYRGAPLLAADHDEARRLSLGFLRWLQTECPRDGGGTGYPELKLRPDVMGTEDGLAKRPYVREGRRLVARRRIVEQDLVTEAARARLFPDSVGVGLYGIDLHGCAGDADDTTGRWIAAKPFQIPLGAMVPVRIRNLLAAGKALGTSHVTNGAYRLHPVEWNTGESAGRVAAFCLERRVEPADVLESPPLLRALQWRLLQAGVPLFWYVDLEAGTPTWSAAQFLAVVSGEAADPETLEFGASLERAVLAQYLTSTILME